MATFEPVELKILSSLQAEGRLTNQELSERVGTSTSPCWRKVRQLEEAGVIQGPAKGLWRRAGVLEESA